MKTLAEKLKIKPNQIQKILSFSALIILFIFFSIFAPHFLTTTNLTSILLQTAVNGILAIGVTFVIITGGIDLSVGTAMTFTGVIAGTLVNNLGLPIWLALIGGLLTGILLGAVTGLLVAKIKVPAFIATLGMMMVTKGLSLVVSGAAPVYFPRPDEGFVITDLALNKWFGIPIAVYIFFALAILAGFILNRTPLGRYTFAIGSNEEATRLSGVNTDKWLIIIHGLTGLFVGFAGIVMASRLGSAQPHLGQGYELEAIAAVVIGGTSLSGGKGTILGTVIGAFIMTVLLVGLRMMGVPQEWQTVITGIIVIGAVVLDIVQRRRSKS